jgi:hypothetical protein
MSAPYKSRRADLVEVECRCPFCSEKHIKKMHWTGRGTPRIACPKHSTLFRESDPGDLVYYASCTHGRKDSD